VGRSAPPHSRWSEHVFCGACTVTVDGMIARACLTLAGAVDGSDVRTRGRSRAGSRRLGILHGKLSNAITRCNAASAPPDPDVASIITFAKRPRPTEAELRDLLSGHLCRCTATPRSSAPRARRGGTCWQTIIAQRRQMLDLRYQFSSPVWHAIRPPSRSWTPICG